MFDWTNAEGKRQRISLSSNKRAAERVRADMVHRRDLTLAGLGAEAGQDLSLGEVFDLYVEDLRTRVSSGHLKNVSQRLGHVIGLLEDKTVGDLRPMDLVRIRTQATARGSSRRTANLLVDRVRTMLNWAVDEGLIAANPVARMKRLPEAGHEKCRRRAMSDDEIARFLAESERDDEQCSLIWDYERVPQTVFWMGLLETGGRYGEMRQAAWGDLDLKRCVLVLRPETTKASKQRAIPLREEFAERLHDLKVLHERVLGRIPTMNDPIFLSPEGRPWGRYSTNPMRIFRRVLERAGIRRVDEDRRKLDIHSIRVTANTRMARRGVSIDKRQRILGHGDPRLTACTYLDLGVEDLRDAVEAVGPIGARDVKQKQKGVAQ